MSNKSLPKRSLAIALVGGFLFLISLSGCGGDDAAVGLDEVEIPDEVEITAEISTDIATDDGDVGVVIDVRDIFRKGYVATTAEITFQDYPEFSATLDIDPTTSLAILSIDTDSLTEGELTAFAAGVVANIVITDAGQVVLADFDDDALVLDNFNLPLSISTDLEYVRRPMALRQDLPYLLQLEGRNGLVAQPMFRDGVEPDVAFVIDDVEQQFYFTPVQGSDDTYFIENITPRGFGDPDRVAQWRVIDDDPVGTRWLIFSEADFIPRADLVLEQDEDGWVKMRLKETQEYLVFDANVPGQGMVMRLTMDEPDRFRLISDDIAWQLTDRGTVFNQPIMGPARLDFAYKATLRNCSGATLTQTIGRSEQRTRTTTVGTSESLQLFASATLSLDVKIGFSVTAKVGVDIQGIGEAGSEVTQSAEVSVGTSVTTSVTKSSENTWSASQSTTTEVSESITLTLPPFTALEAYNAVKTIDNVRVPFTQVLRITATDKDDGSALSGREIQSQMLFNFVGGVVRTVGDDHIDIGFRGQATIDQLFESTTDVFELAGACG